MRHLVSDLRPFVRPYYNAVATSRIRKIKDRGYWLMELCLDCKDELNMRNNYGSSSEEVSVSNINNPLGPPSPARSRLF